MKKRIGIFGWGLVAPRSSNIKAFEENLLKEESWLTPFNGVGPSNFLVGMPDFDFEDYKPWIDQRFEPRRFSQLDSKMGENVKYTIGAFIQALGQNPGLEGVLKNLGTQAHVYIGTGLGAYDVQYASSLSHYKAQIKWNRFWCREEHNSALAGFQKLTGETRAEALASLGAPKDPATVDRDDEDYYDTLQAWYAFWVHRSEGLKGYLSELSEIEGATLGADIDKDKGHTIRRKMTGRQKLLAKYGAPQEPWNAVDANLLWNISNIPAAQVSMLGKLTGPTFAPVAACSTFGTSLWLASNAIKLGQAKAVVVGATDPAPHPLSIGTFYNAKVLTNDGVVSKPCTGLKGTHVSGGACVWIVCDYDYMTAQGFTPLGLELIGVGVTSDADHIITPSEEGPRAAINLALADAGIDASAISNWDMHATATPGDWMEFQNIKSAVSDSCIFTARKGIFGHGMSVCGGWELTAQHMGMVRNRLFPTNISCEELHPVFLPDRERLVCREGAVEENPVAAKMNMGVGGINACVISRKY